MAKLVKRGAFQTIEEWAKTVTVNTNHLYKFDLKNAPEMIQTAVANGEKITIIGDYDCDGICASAILASALLKMGCRPTVRLPLRFSEGYGMKPSMVEEIDSGLVITVDNGIAALDAVEAAKKKGLKVIVTDHHSVVKECVPSVRDGIISQTTIVKLPNADCIINPHVEETLGETGRYDFYDYCGAGVALKLAEELLGKDDGIMERLYAFAALATVADVMPIVEDNRNIVIRGINAMARGEITAGLYQLLAQNKIDVGHMPDGFLPHNYITPDVLGYKLAPCVNAVSRLIDSGAYIALALLMCDIIRLAVDKAKALIEKNEERKRITESEQIEVDRIIKENGMENDCPLVVHIKDSAPGIIGLHAGRLCEQYKVPVIVINGEGDNCKGSCRSPEGANIKALLDAVQDSLVAYGGHPGAAGLTIKESEIDNFRARLIEECKKQGIKAQSTDEIYYDFSVDASEIKNIIPILERMAPFGEGNPEPVFLIKDFPFDKVSILGGKHLKFTGGEVSAIGFNLCGEGDVVPSDVESGCCFLVGTLGYNCFRGNATPQIQIFVIPSAEDIEKHLNNEEQDQDQEQEQEAER